MTRYSVEIERPLCIACESCVNICPEFWEMAPDGFSHLKGNIQKSNRHKKNSRKWK